MTPRLPKLLSEIHSRSLWQVLGIYLAASFGVLQVVDTLTGVLQLPDWFPSFALVLLIVGLPVVLSTAFLQRGIHVGRAPPSQDRESPEPIGEDGLYALFTWRNAIAGGVLAFALWGVVAAGWVVLGAGQSMGTATADSDSGPRSIAVLPFENFSGDAENSFFVEGMHDAVLTHLQRIDGLSVVSRTSVMRYSDTDLSIPEIADELGGVEWFVEGSVLWDGDRVRITAQLIDGDTDMHLWADDYTRSIEDVFALQGDVARAIAGEINVVLSPEEERRLTDVREVDPEAYQEYLLGWYNWNRRTGERLLVALEHFERALEVDSTYALAWAGLANTYVLLPQYLPMEDPRGVMAEGEAAARRAIELEPELAEAYASLALALSGRSRYEWAAADSLFGIAIELNPGYATAYHWRSFSRLMRRRFDDVLVDARTATDLDPLSAIVAQNLGRALLFSQNDAEAIDRLLLALELNPNMDTAWFWLGLAYLHTARYGEAGEALGRWADLNGRPSSVGEGYARLVRRHAEIGRPVDVPGDLDVTTDVPAGIVALQFMLLGQEASAMEWLEAAFEEGDPWHLLAYPDRSFDRIRGTPRYQLFSRQIGLGG